MELINVKVKENIVTSGSPMFTKQSSPIINSLHDKHGAVGLCSQRSFRFYFNVINWVESVIIDIFYN